MAANGPGRAVGAKPGETIVDLCAGAGGKTLGLAAMMDNRGTLIASDTDRGRLQRLPPRAQKAGADMIATVLLNPGRELAMLSDYAGTADAVLVDAPCSGTGTWRRNPEARWRLGKGELLRFAETQDRLLHIAAKLVRPGGRIIYVTCSLLDEEGPDRIAAFAKAEPQFQPVPLDWPVGRPRGGGVRLDPASRRYRRVLRREACAFRFPRLSQTDSPAAIWPCPRLPITPPSRKPSCASLPSASRSRWLLRSPPALVRRRTRSPARVPRC